MGKNLRDYARYGSIGISWVMASLIYVYLGYRGGTWLDSRWGSEGIFALFGLLAGLGLSVYSLVEELSRIEKAWRREKADEEEGKERHREQP